MAEERAESLHLNLTQHLITLTHILATTVTAWTDRYANDQAIPQRVKRQGMAEATEVATAIIAPKAMG